LESGRKVFFFEKKKQKTFVRVGFGFTGWAKPKGTKVFWFFFSKKNRFLHLERFLGGRGDKVKMSVLP